MGVGVYLILRSNASPGRGMGLRYAHDIPRPCCSFLPYNVMINVSVACGTTRSVVICW